MMHAMLAPPRMPESPPDLALPIGCFAAIGRDRLADDLVAFGKLRPDIAVGVHAMARAGMLAALRSDEIALGLMPGEPEPCFRSVKLWEDEAVLALPLDHPLAARDAVDAEELRDLLFLVSRRPNAGEAHRFLTRRLLGPAASPPGDIRDCGMGGLLELVAAGEGIALACLSHDHPACGQVALRPVRHAKARFGVYAHWRDEAASPALHALLAVLRRES